MDLGTDFVPASKMIHQDNVKMTGFLEKKGKMKLVSPWKKYWFVLDKRLLLYYRSEIEYANLSPCRGSLNMGLVTTVRPGSSSGPCVIHIVTRTQAMQLRAKNRAAQEEWLQALLHSMAIPVVPKSLKPSSLKPKVIGHTASLDNVSISNGWKRCNQAAEDWSLPRRLNHRKRQISGSYYGGSLDTAIWTKKFRPIRTPTSDFLRNKLVEKYLESPKPYNSSPLVTSSQRELRQMMSNEPKQTANNSHSDDAIPRKDGDRKCKVHDDKPNRNSFGEFPHGLAERLRRTKTMTNDQTPFSDNLVTKQESRRFLKLDKKDESPFEKLKNALSRVPKEKIIRKKPDIERKGSVKKRRQSFLQKVFRRIGHEAQEDSCESDVGDCFYDVINPSKMANGSIKKENKIECESPPNGNKTDDGVVYAEVRKIATGTKMISSDAAISEPKTGMAESQGSLLEEGIILSENEESGDENGSTGSDVKDGETSTAPLLPPRRVSRPVSPWHDVPTNNAPIDSEKKIFFSHQAVVKFKEPPLPCMTLNELISTDSKLNILEPSKTPETGDVELRQKNKNDDLSFLLEQLTKITVTPFKDVESSDSEVKLHSRTSPTDENCEKSNSQDPDYDVPRPHKPLTVISGDQNENFPSNDLAPECQDNSDKSLSLHSMEPDSLDSINGKHEEV